MLKNVNTYGVVIPAPAPRLRFGRARLLSSASPTAAPVGGKPPVSPPPKSYTFSPPCLYPVVKLC